MEQFAERLARLAELSDPELASTEQELVAAFKAADSDGDIEAMKALVAALDSLRDEKSNRGTTAPAPVAPEAAPAVEEPVAASANDGEGDEAPADTPAEEETPEETPETEPAADPEPEATPAEEAKTEAPAAEAAPEVKAEAAGDGEAEQTETEAPAEKPVAEAPAEDEGPASEEPTQEDPAVEEAATTPDESEESVDTKITAEDVPEENAPVAAAVAPLVIRAGGDIPGYTAGSQLADMDEVSEALSKKINTMRGVGGDGEHIVVASMRYEEEVPDGRLLRAGDAAGNSRKIRELISDRDALQPGALTAAAWCAPRAPVYDVPTIGTTSRPVAESLPTFTADRGGITWMQPPGAPTTGGIGLWRHDGTSWESFPYGDPAGTGTPGTTKPCVTIACGTEQSIDVDALTLCLCFSNMMTRAFPEWVRANTDLVMVAQARFAEQVLLSRMFNVTASGAANPGTQVGAARDFFIVVRTAAANFRWENRLGQRAPMQLLAPSWVAEAMAADLDLQQPGDDTLGTSLAEINALFNEINVDPIWYIDDVPGQAAFSASFSFPATANWMLYPTGTFLRLDSGDLNLGVVRDMTNVQANTYCEFSETFETVAYMGPAAPNLWVVRGNTNIDLAGSSGAARAITIS